MAILLIFESEKNNFYSISEFMYFQYLIDILILSGRYHKKTILTLWQLKILPFSLNDLFYHQLFLILFDFKSLLLIGNLIFSFYLMFQFGILQGVFSLSIFLLVFISIQSVFLNILSAFHPMMLRKNIHPGSIIVYGFSLALLAKTIFGIDEVHTYFPIISWAEKAIIFVLNGNWWQGMGFVGLFGIVILVNLFVFRKILVHERYE